MLGVYGMLSFSRSDWLSSFGTSLYSNSLSWLCHSAAPRSHSFGAAILCMAWPLLCLTKERPISVGCSSQATSGFEGAGTQRSARKCVFECFVIC